MTVTRNEQCTLIHSWCTEFECNPWIARTNSDIKRIFEQNGVRIYKDDSKEYKTYAEYKQHENLDAIKYFKDLRIVKVNMHTKMSELQYGDYLFFGKPGDLKRVFLQVYNDIPYSQPDTTIYKWIIDNRQDLYDIHFEFGIYKEEKKACFSLKNLVRYMITIINKEILKWRWKKFSI